MWTHVLFIALTGCSPLSRDVVLLTDVTGSMSQQQTTTSTRLKVTRDAARALAAGLVGDGLPDRLGVVTFVAGAELWYPLADIEQPEGLAAADAQLATLDWCDRSYDPWDTTHDGVYFHDAPQMMGCDTAELDGPETNPSDAGTAYRDGMALALEAMLEGDPRRRERLAVLFTDGLPTCVPASDDCEATRYDEALDAADALADHGSEVYVVYYEEDPSDTDSAEKLCALASRDYLGDNCVKDNPWFARYLAHSEPTSVDIDAILERQP